MKKKIMGTIFAVTLSTILLSACGGNTSESLSTSTVASAHSFKTSSSSGSKDDSNTISSGSASGTGSGNDMTIKVVLKTLSADYWQYVKKGCEQAGKDLGVRVDIVGATSETAYDEQIVQLETIMQSGNGDALVVSPLQSETVATQIKDIKMPVIAIDTEVPSDKVTSFVGFNNEDMGELGGKAGVEAAKKVGWSELKAVFIAGVQGDPTSEARQKGFQKGVEEAGGTFLADEVQYADSVADKAVTCMEGIMQTHPEGIAVIFCNDDSVAIAAAKAAKGNAAYENTQFIGAGGSEAGLQSILNGEISMTVTFDGYDVGYKGVQAAVDAVNGKQLGSFIASEGSVVDKSNAQQQLDLVKQRMNR
ncbi:MAG: sugar ABC transporter substrate-binding protein [Lachnospiraceae bacterium]|nr:sugar ABC transporter substrate-binding protein [Lachnospiraceae bacterium]